MTETKPDRCPQCDSPDKAMRQFRCVPVRNAETGHFTIIMHPWHDAPTPAPQDEAAKPETQDDSETRAHLHDELEDACLSRGNYADVHGMIDRLADALAEKERINVSLTGKLRGALEQIRDICEENASLLKRAEAAERLHDDHCEFQAYDACTIVEPDDLCVPPWRQGR